MLRLSQQHLACLLGQLRLSLNFGSASAAADLFVKPVDDLNRGPGLGLVSLDALIDQTESRVLSASTRQCYGAE